MSEKLNCLGKACPIPVIETKKKLAEIPVGTQLDISVDGDTQVQNLKRMASNMGFSAEAQPEEGHFVVRITKNKEINHEDHDTYTCETAPQQKHGKTVAVFAADHMGEGDEALGKVLIKAFVFALTQLDKLPDTLLFYNGGVHLTTEGSPVLEDLQKLKEAGVEIFSCGTCLKALNLEDKLQIGEVSNMYSIVEMQLEAAVILRP